jgi:hypothetical protein
MRGGRGRLHLGSVFGGDFLRFFLDGLAVVPPGDIHEFLDTGFQGLRFAASRDQVTASFMLSFEVMMQRF